MDADTQIDLAKEEVPAEQVWDSPLQHTATHLFLPNSQTTDSRRSSLRSTRGSHLATYQLPRSRSPSGRLGHQSGQPAKRDHDLDEKDIGQGQHIVQLPPVDGGFGAWSYVYATFSMYIVVWGSLTASISSILSLTDVNYRLIADAHGDDQDFHMHSRSSRHTYSTRPAANLRTQSPFGF